MSLLAAAENLARIPAGLADPVHHSQAVFRALLEALARPGRVQAPAPAAQRSLGHPAAFSPALAAALLTLLDAETALWLAPSLRSAEAEAWCRFHTGARVAELPEVADFAAAQASEVGAGLWSSLRAGSDEAPHTSATLLIDVASLSDGLADTAAQRLRLTGPGIEHEHLLAVGGLDAAFWAARIAQQAAFPCGVDLLLCCDARVAGLPRSTRIELMDT